MSAATSAPAARSFLDLEDGMHYDVPEALYHERVLGLANKGALDKINRSPAHYLAWVLGRLAQEESPALAFGKALHCRILEPSRFRRLYVVAPDFGDCRVKENKARRDAWRAEHAGAEHIDADDMAALEGIAASIQAHPIAKTILADGAAEVTAKWTDPETGIACKARGDLWIPKLGTLVDLKSTEDARPDEFARSCARYRYFVQEAWYRDGFKYAGADLEDFVFVAVEKKPPYAVAVYQLDEDAVALGTSQYEANLRTLAECIATDTWPAYDTAIRELSLPRWA